MSRLARFRRVDGDIEREFSDREQTALFDLCGSLGAILVEADPADPAVRRLLPDAVPTDAVASEEFAEAVRDRLREGKALRAAELVADLQAAEPSRRGVTVRLERAEAVRWLQTLGDLRLLLAERYGVERLHEPDAPGALYTWLTWLQGELVELLPPR